MTPEMGVVEVVPPPPPRGGGGGREVGEAKWAGAKNWACGPFRPVSARTVSVKEVGIN